MKAMERLFQGKKRASEGAKEGENRPKRTRRETGDAMERKEYRDLQKLEKRNLSWEREDRNNNFKHNNNRLIS